MSEPIATPPAAEFLFVTCQVGAEAALKSELKRLWPEFRFAYSRPGFLTFKLPPDHGLPEDFELQAVFARAYGFSLGKTKAVTLSERAVECWQTTRGRNHQALHVWQRDPVTVGFHGFEPHLTPAAGEALAALQREHARFGTAGAPLVTDAIEGMLVLDCVLVEEGEWWIGYHRARADESRFAGGLRSIAAPDEMISRAYLKMVEALEWSGLPIERGQTFVEIGCAPGGASQALLARGLKVLGVDPAQVDPRIAGHPNFTHLQKRGSEVRKREFRGAQWLAADMNVAPQYTLDTVEAIVTHAAVNIRGLLLTLKLPDWQLAENLDAYRARVRSWGYDQTKIRQLAHNRQEVCLAAWRTEKRPRPKSD